VKWEEKLIKLYLCISENKNMNNYLLSIRQSNNYVPKFSDQEAITLYIFGTQQKIRHTKDIHRYAKQHLQHWFPNLPCYQAFNHRLNFIAPVFSIFLEEVMREVNLEFAQCNESVLDSMPIILAGKTRSQIARVSRDVCGKGYCASKNMYYYGLKLHVLGFVNPGTLPVPECCWFGPAQESDLTAARPFFAGIYNRKIYADKIYRDAELNKKMIQDQNSIIITPIKKALGQKELDAADALFSAAVSRVRQPIESFFNWLNEKTGIQNATKVRSTNGLWLHVWGKLAAAFICRMMYFNP
jgi:Transposase DDE domain